MRKHWLCLASSDFGRSVTLSHSTDLIDCEAVADSLATDAIVDGNDFAYVYELKQVYLPRPKEPTKEVEVVYVDQGE